MQKLHDEGAHHSTTIPRAVDFARVFMTAVTQEDWRRIAAKAVEQAGRGDRRAQAWLRRWSRATSPRPDTKFISRNQG